MGRGLLLTLALLTVWPVLSQSPVAVTAEALGQANLRAAATLESELRGEIFHGQRWPVLARSEIYPWYLLGDASGQAMGWVYADLVTLDGDNRSLPLSTLIVPANSLRATPASAPATGSMTRTPQTSTPAPRAAVYGALAGTVNIRQGPGVEYARIALGQAGERFRLTARHSLLPWVQVLDARAPTGRAWIALDLLDIEGDLASLPLFTQTVLHLPTLTPTPSLGQVSTVDGQGSSQRGAPVDLVAVARQAWDLVLEAGFERESGQPAALYIVDLTSGGAVGFHEHLAFSGTSIQKINILTALFATLQDPLSRDLAVDVANTMICSENVATNRLLAQVGGGDTWAGAAQVTALLENLGMSGSYLLTPYTIPGQPLQPPAVFPKIPATLKADAVAEADPWNRITARDAGQQLASLYYCAGGGDTSLRAAALEERECRQALLVMRNNTVDALLRAGVPSGTEVAHKHGWIADTHSNAALFRTPGGDYVIVLLLKRPQWLDFQRSLPLMAEVSRLVYNAYNPGAALDSIREGFIPEAARCNFSASPLIDELLAAP
ncbi:MAG: serine hydrolase [Anaerolineaceae bacterium]|nr:serine hydrolase [Anaerolineaceae bacterium]